MQSLSVSLPGRASSVPPARHFVERTLASWGLAELGWTAAVVVTELAANAALHARTAFTVALSRDGDRVRLEVADGSLQQPRTRRHGLESTTGRGLRMLDDLAQSWGVQATSGGKTVWCELTTAAAGTDRDSGEDVDALLSAFSDDLEEPDGARPHRPDAQAQLRRAAA